MSTVAGEVRPPRTRANAEEVLAALESLTTGAMSFDVQELPARGLSEAIAITVPVRLAPGQVFIGPITDPRLPATPCYRCFDLRWLELRTAEEQRAVEEGTMPLELESTSVLSEFVIRAIVLSATAMIAAAMPGEVIELSTKTLAVRRVELLAHSGCEICANQVADTAELVRRPDSQDKSAPDNYRLRAASEFRLPEHALINEACGVIGARRFTVYQCTATLPVSGFFRVRSRFDFHDMWWSGQTESARASQIMGMLEGLERHAGQYARSRTTAQFASRRQLGEKAIDPRHFGRYPAEFFAAHADSYRPFEDDNEMPWVWAYSYRRDAPVLLPEQVVYYLDRTPDPKFVQECSSGCASGATPTEAVFHGLLELVERDAFLLNWGANAAVPELDPSSFLDPDIGFVTDRLNRLGYSVRFFDLRVDIPVPTVLVVAERIDGGLGRLCIAAGASFDPITAVKSALAEVASYVPGLDERVLSRRPELLAMTDDWAKVTELTHHALLYGLPEMRDTASFLVDRGTHTHRIEDVYSSWLEQRPATLDLKDDVEYLVDHILSDGADVFTVDQTSPEQKGTGVHTACVRSSGLVPIDFGWQRQRLFSHPRLARYIDGEIAEVNATIRPAHQKHLNRAPHPFP